MNCLVVILSTRLEPQSRRPPHQSNPITPDSHVSRAGVRSDRALSSPSLLNVHVFLTGTKVKRTRNHPQEKTAAFDPSEAVGDGSRSLSFLSDAWLSTTPVFPKRQLKSFNSGGERLSVTDFSHTRLVRISILLFCFQDRPCFFLGPTANTVWLPNSPLCTIGRFFILPTCRSKPHSDCYASSCFLQLRFCRNGLPKLKSMRDSRLHNQNSGTPPSLISVRQTLHFLPSYALKTRKGSGRVHT